MSKHPPISVRLSPDERAGLRRVAPGGTVSDAVKQLIADRLPELAREGELIAALDEAFRKLTIAVSPSQAGTVPVVVKAERRTRDAPALEDLAVVEARRRGAQVAIELVGRGEFESTRIMLVVAPVGRRVKFEVVPGELASAVVEEAMTG
jgi:hypothetical protein